MSEPFDLSKMQDGAERMALMQAQFYDTLVRSNIPPEIAVALAQHYIATIITAAFQMQAQQQGGKKG